MQYNARDSCPASPLNFPVAFLLRTFFTFSHAQHKSLNSKRAVIYFRFSVEVCVWMCGVCKKKELMLMT